MKSLVVTNMYPSETDLYAGVFVQREVEALRACGVDVQVCHVNTPSSKTRYLTSRPAVTRAIAAAHPDVVHVHFGLTQVVVPDATQPRVVTFHGSDLTEPWKRAVSRAFARGSDAVVVVAPHLEQHVADLGIPVSVIPAGVVRDAFGTMTREEARRRLGLPMEATVALFPASQRRRVKRYQLFHDAVDLVGDLVPVVLDDVEPGEVAAYLSAVDVVVLTSLREGSPVVTKEALCSGTRVVSVSVGDMEWQLSGLSGCSIAPVDTAKAVADSIRAVLAMPAPDAEVARARFDVRREAEAVLRVYESVLRG